MRKQRHGILGVPELSRNLLPRTRHQELEAAIGAVRRTKLASSRTHYSTPQTRLAGSAVRSQSLRKVASRWREIVTSFAHSTRSSSRKPSCPASRVRPRRMQLSRRKAAITEACSSRVVGLEVRVAVAEIQETTTFLLRMATLAIFRRARVSVPEIRHSIYHRH
jgi:hypothetical protein